MVELCVDLNDCHTANEDIFVSVRVGEFQKLTRLSQTRTYHFPNATRRMGKIEIYKRVGCSSFDCNPSFHEKRNVNVQSNDGSVGCLGFKVGVSSAKHEQDTASAKPPSVKATVAKEYVTRHGIEAQLADAMQALLRELPDNPSEFLAHKLMEFSRCGSIVLPPAGFTKKAPQAACARSARSRSTNQQKVWHMNPSVSTWLARPIRLNKMPAFKSFRYRPSVGSWLESADAQDRAVLDVVRLPIDNVAAMHRQDDSTEGSANCNRPAAAAAAAAATGTARAEAQATVPAPGTGIAGALAAAAAAVTKATTGAT
eukprot:TRINITY_DN13766_c1_g2_i3.p1 TRINITY_DN13766_c1_g2~~TRINITY_DN13766_c1_g2_i3.p1  ORF type:complete len:313 (+),score=68.63 TRINITY_DN13766_c1_g2_i3:63-1001(+)